MSNNNSSSRSATASAYSRSHRTRWSLASVKTGRLVGVLCLGVIFQQPTQPLAASDGTVPLCIVVWQGHQSHLALPLMRAFLVKMRHVFYERIPEGTLAKQHQPRQRFLLHRAHPPLGVSIQMRKPWRERHACDTSLIDDLLKRGTVLAVSVVDQILTRMKAPQLAIVTLRAICIIHRGSGCGVSPAI